MLCGNDDALRLRRVLAFELRVLRRGLRTMRGEADPSLLERMMRRAMLRRFRIARGYARLRLIGAG